MGTTDWLGAGARIGDYVVERELPAKPGLVAWSAAHGVLPRRARISTVHLAFLDNASVATQLTREACLLEALRHPGVPRVFECGVLSDRRPWVATELIEGPSLSSILAEEGRLGVPAVLSLLAEIASILHHVHARGLVHRNLRPEVITRRPDGPSIIDWGDARARDEVAPARVTRDWAAYQPPEVLAGEHADSRADVFSLGVVACEALAGVRTARATAVRFPAAPARLTALLDRMLARDPLARPTSAEIRAEALAVAAQLVAPQAAPPDEDAEVQIVDVELGAGMAAEAEAEPEPEPPPSPPKPPKLRWVPGELSTRARTKTMPKTEPEIVSRRSRSKTEPEISSRKTMTMPAPEVEISAKQTMSMSAVELEALTRTKIMPAVAAPEAAPEAAAADAVDAAAIEPADSATKTTTMAAVDPAELEAARTKTETMPPSPAQAALRPDPAPAPPEPDPEPPSPRTSTRLGKLALPPRIIERTRTKLS